MEALPCSYQDLEDWTKLMLRKIKRSIDVAKDAPDDEDRDPRL